MASSAMDIDDEAESTSANQTPPTPVAPRAYHANRFSRSNTRNHYFVSSRSRPQFNVGYGAYDDPHNPFSFNRSFTPPSAGLDYDEKPAHRDSEESQASPPTEPRRDRNRFTNRLPAQAEIYQRSLTRYEAPAERPKDPPFLGYDDLPFFELRNIWINLDIGRISYQVLEGLQEQAKNLVSYESEEHQTQHWKAEKIDRDRAINEYNFRVRVAQRNFDRILKAWEKRISQPVFKELEHTEGQVSRQQAQNKWQIQLGVITELLYGLLQQQDKPSDDSEREDDTYRGPGPTHEITDSLDSFLVGEREEQKVIVDTEMEASPYSDRRRDGGGRRGGRHSYGGGGGGGGGRKRGREDDDDQGGYRQRQRPRYEEPIASRIRRDIIFIGETEGGHGVQDTAAGFGRDIANNFEDDQVRGPLLDTLIDMIVEQPLKLPHLAAVAHYANDLNVEAGKEFIARASKKLKKALELGDWRDFKLLLRFHACLQDIFEGTGIFVILHQLFDWVIDLQTASADDALGLELLRIVLLTIPYAIAGSPNAKDQIGDLLDKCEIIALEAANHPLASLVDPYPIDGEDKPFGYQSVVEMLQKQLREEANNGWEVKCIPRVYGGNKRPKAEGENGTAPETPKLPLPALTIPVPVDVLKKPLFPETYFSIFADQEIQTVPGANNVALSLIRDVLIDTVNISDYNRIAVANYMVTLDNFWAPGTFASRAITLDQLRNYPAERSTWKLEDMFIDAIFSQLLILPREKHKLIYYHSIIFEACKISPTAVAPTLGRAIRWLFRHIDDMDMELLYRFLDWFAHHLSNFEFRWKWIEWIDELEKSDLTPKKAFIIAAVDKEIRLSFAKRIRDTLPEPYWTLISAGKTKDIPDFKFNEKSTPFASEGKEILDRMKKKDSEDVIQPYIDSIQEQAASHNLDPLLASTDVYVTAMCHNGAKSVSHITAGIDRSKERLLNASQQSPAVGRQIIESVVSYWKDQPGNAVNIVDKLLNYTIVLPSNVIDWALGAEGLGNGSVLAQAWRYEIVAKTMTKVTGRVEQIALAKIQTEVQAANAAESEDPAAVQTALDQMNDLLVNERNTMRLLFATIEDSVAGVASGAADGMLDSDTSEEDGQLIRSWGDRWARVFRRKLAVEEARVSEAAVEVQLASEKEQDGLRRERAKREAEEEAAARAKIQEERAARIKKEEDERAAAAAAADAEKANGDAAMADANGNDDADLDVAE